MLVPKMASEPSRENHIPPDHPLLLRLAVAHHKHTQAKEQLAQLEEAVRMDQKVGRFTHGPTPPMPRGHHTTVLAHQEAIRLAGAEVSNIVDELLHVAFLHKAGSPPDPRLWDDDLSPEWQIEEDGPPVEGVHPPSFLYGGYVYTLSHRASDGAHVLSLPYPIEGTDLSEIGYTLVEPEPPEARYTLVKPTPTRSPTETGNITGDKTIEFVHVPGTSEHVPVEVLPKPPGEPMPDQLPPNDAGEAT